MANTRDTDFWVPEQRAAFQHNGYVFKPQQMRASPETLSPEVLVTVEKTLSAVVSYNLELVQDLKAITSIDAEDELTNILTADAEDLFVASMVNDLGDRIFQGNVEAGWWSDLDTGESTVGKRNKGELLMLVVTEIAEGYEGVRKNLMDDKLPHRKMLEVELADAIIRILDIARSEKLDIGGAIVEKLAFNKTREDHKIENRRLPNGKKT